MQHGRLFRISRQTLCKDYHGLLVAFKTLEGNSTTIVGLEREREREREIEIEIEIER